MSSEITPYTSHIDRATYEGDPNRPWPGDALIAAIISEGTDYLARIITNPQDDEHYADDYLVRATGVEPYFRGVGFRIPGRPLRRIMIWPLEMQRGTFAPIDLDTNEVMEDSIPNIPEQLCVDGFGQLRKRRRFFVEKFNPIYGYLMSFGDDEGGSKVDLPDNPNWPSDSRSPRLSPSSGSVEEKVLIKH